MNKEIMMRHVVSLLHIKTVHQGKKRLGLFFIVLQFFWVIFFQLGISNYTFANVITSYGLEKGDQSTVDQLFHEGMQAYMASNFQQAYTLWGQAAEKNHPKAVFNIGTMWLQGQVPGQPENKQQAFNFFEQAITLGYEPARVYLNKSSENFAKDRSISINTDESSTPENNNEPESNSNQADEENSWLTSYSDNAWVIQVFASQEPDLLKQMIRDYSLKDKAQILTEKVENKLWYKLIYGQYPTKNNALNSIKSLPQLLRKEKPWVRSVSAMKNAQ